MKPAKKDIQSVVAKELPEFTGECSNLTADQLNARLAQLAKDGEAVSEAKDADPWLETARAQVSELAGPYNDAKKAVRMKSQYIISLLKDRGNA